MLRAGATIESCRILTISPRFVPYVGGAENVARLIVENTNDGRFSNDVLTELCNDVVDAADGRELSLQDAYAGAQIFRFRRARLRGREKNGPVFKYYNFAQYVYRLLRLQANYDVLHAHTFHWPAFAAVLATSISKKPVVVTGHLPLQRMYEDMQRGMYPRSFERLLRKVTSYVAISESIVDEATQRLGLPRDRVQLIPNGIDTTHFRPAADPAERNNLRRKLGLPLDVPIIMTHGRLEHDKNTALFIDTVARLLASGIDVHGIIAGAGSKERELAQLIQSKQLGEHVQLLGFKRNTNEYLRASAVYVLPSFIEGLPLALLEAMASGLECVASDISGNNDVIDHGHNGFLFDLNEPNALYDRLREVMLALPEPAASVGPNARRSVERSYSISVMVERYKLLYAELGAARA